MPVATATPAKLRDPAVYLITGPMAVGNSTVARLLAARFKRGVHLEGDVFRRSVVSGRAELTPALEPEALDQLELRHRLTTAAADSYFRAGFAVALEDVFAGPTLGAARTAIRARPCHVVVLMPATEAIAAREAGRARKGYGHWSIQALYDGFVNDTPRVGLWLDTTDLTPEQTVDTILARTAAQAARSRAPIVISDYDAVLRSGRQAPPPVSRRRRQRPAAQPPRAARAPA